ncbi:Pyridoxal 5'-phosphate synthase subunit PdxT [compost metagenome]
MSKKVLIPLPRQDFDPTECAIPWKVLKQSGVEIIFATPNTQKASCDPLMLSGEGLGLFASTLVANKEAQQAYSEMEISPEFQNPISWESASRQTFDGLILPGGHAQGMKEYLESELLQKIAVDFFKTNKPVGAICHGVIVLARAKDENNQPLLKNRKTTALLATQELLAWNLTRLWQGDYYRTYPQTVESEVTGQLAKKENFLKGPLPLSRDSAKNLKPGFVVQDGNYLSARWPGDAHKFASSFAEMLLTKS